VGEGREDLNQILRGERGIGIGGATLKQI